MRTLLILLLLNVIIFSSVKAQTCLGMALKAGTNVELATFRANDKPTGKLIYQIKDVRKEGNTTIMDITAHFQNEKGREQPPYSIRYACTGDELTADLSGMMTAMQNAGAKDMTMKLKSNQLVYPGRLSAGQKLADGRMEAEMISNGSTLMTMLMNMNNRQVEGRQTLTVPAGTFDAFKITSDMNVESKVMGFPVRNTMRVVSYRTDDQIFDIKSENYDKNGKLIGYMLLNRIY